MLSSSTIGRWQLILHFTRNKAAKHIVIGELLVLGAVMLPEAVEGTLPLSGERSRQDSVNPFAVVYPPVVLAPDDVVGVAGKVVSGDMMVGADLDPPQTEEQALHLIGVDRCVGIALEMIDPLNVMRAWRSSQLALSSA